jgi:hypothetical protein
MAKKTMGTKRRPKAAPVKSPIKKKRTVEMTAAPKNSKKSTNASGFVVTQAKRKGVWLRLLNYGISGSGKTGTSIMEATELCEALGLDPAKAIGVVDTERGSALLEAKSNSNPDGFEFLHVELPPPYTVERYQGAIQALLEAGCQVIVVDSTSHIWMGLGGILQEVADLQEGMTNQRAAWNKPSQAMDTFINWLMQIPAHLICTMRAKRKDAMEYNDKTGKTEMRALGVQPVMRSDIEFEFTALAEFDDKQTQHFRNKSRVRVNGEPLRGHSFKKNQVKEFINEWVLPWLEDEKIDTNSDNDESEEDEDTPIESPKPATGKKRPVLEEPEEDDEEEEDEDESDSEESDETEDTDDEETEDEETEDEEEDEEDDSDSDEESTEEDSDDEDEGEDESDDEEETTNVVYRITRDPEARERNIGIIEYSEQRFLDAGLSKDKLKEIRKNALSGKVLLAKASDEDLDAYAAMLPERMRLKDIPHNLSEFEDTDEPDEEVDERDTKEHKELVKRVLNAEAWLKEEDPDDFDNAPKLNKIRIKYLGVGSVQAAMTIEKLTAYKNFLQERANQIIDEQNEEDEDEG